MASQIAHIVYAKKYFDFLEFGKSSENFEDIGIINIPVANLNKDQFLLGCVFPDVRRIDSEIKRKDTHFRFEKLDLDFSGLNSFQAGWKFHLYCDMKREDILNSNGFYSLSEADGETHSQSAKLLEDELVYDSYNNWEKVISLFRNPPVIDIGMNVSRESFALWYAVMAKYLEEKPNDKNMRIFISKLIGVQDKVEEIISNVADLRKDNKAVEILSDIKNKILK